MGSFHPIVLVLLCTTTTLAYFVGDEAAYLVDFNSLIAGSYSYPRPQPLTAACVNTPQVPYPLSRVEIAYNMDAVMFQNLCGTDKLCIIQPGVTVTMNSDVNVAAIINKGKIQWDDNTQTRTQQYLCGGYIVSEANGIFNLSLASTSKTAFIYIKANGARHDVVGIRVFGGLHRESSPGYPLVEVKGNSLRRTWSLLSENAKKGENVLRLIHNALLMGWKVGDRIAIAPTQRLARADAQTFYIKSIDHTEVYLAADEFLVADGYLNQDYLGEEETHQQAEVLMLTRNVIITGDDFQQYPCGDDVCACSFPGHVCTVGLHTIMHGYNNRFGGTYRIQHTRVEKCGQRGALARYCIHFHAVRDCPDCLVRGNAVEFSHQRGIVVHDSHMTTVSENTLYDVRGAGIYVEDGNEMFNHIEYNAVICPYAFYGSKQGCTIPGTDNSVADTSDNQAAFWSLTHTNNFIGNRAANSYNGILFHPSFAYTGRGISYGAVCVSYVPLGRVEGNTCHGCGRFGLYFASSSWPRKTDMSLAANGHTSTTECAPFDVDGNDRGLSASIWNNVDYHNAFVGSYGLGDIQFRNHYSLDNDNLIYHKESKNFADGCSSHFRNFHFEDGTARLASGWGTILFEDSTFTGSFTFESNHHCGIAATGILCNPQYIFSNPTWQVTSSRWLTWNDADNPTHGSIYNLAPPDALNPSGTMFPKGYQGVCHGYHTYLLALDKGQTCVTSASLGKAVQYENGILCKKPLRRLDVYTQGLDYSTAGTILLQVLQNDIIVTTSYMKWFIVPLDQRKQGFTIPIIASLDYTYRLVRAGGVPLGWIIEFSDPIIGNRWTPDKIRLLVDGRACPAITTSQHDRRFIYASQDEGFTVPGRGACSPYPDMPFINCSTTPDIPLMQCPGLCDASCGANGYCDCGSGRCLCKAGFSGPNCQEDVCASARCGEKGECHARYLGGNLPVVRDACVCEPPYAGPTCEVNPCAGRTCSGRGNCYPQGESGSYCDCNAGFSGSNCETTCDGFCSANEGQFPYLCSVTQDAPSFCGKDGGCAYSSSFFNQNSSWCCFAMCDPCHGITCDKPYYSNDCQLPSQCVDGKCQPPFSRQDGSVCHSELWGICQGGVCVPQKSQGFNLLNSNDISDTPTSFPLNTVAVFIIMTLLANLI